MDRAPAPELDVHDGLEATLTCSRTSWRRASRWSRDYDRTLPKIAAYAGELNQVWTNLIDNAVDAMDGGGTL